MKYWWNAVKYGGEVVSLTPEEAAEAMAAKKLGKPTFEVPRLRAQFDPKQFGEIEESTRPYRDLRHALGSGTAEERIAAEKPRVSPTGSVLVQWVKRLVTERVYQREYANRPGYWPLRRVEDEGGLYVVHSRPVYPSGLPEGLELLEDWEVVIIEKKLADRPGWWNTKEVAV